jgi:actin-related protein 5
MAPSAIDDRVPQAPQEKTYPPAKIFPVKETKFEKFIEPQTDGRKKALEQPGNAAIVIDNGPPSQPRATGREAIWLTVL